MDIKLADHLSYKQKILEKKLLENLYITKGIQTLKQNLLHS